MNEFEVHNDVRENVRIVTVRGEFDISVAPQVKEVLAEAASDPARALVVNLIECEFIDSVGLATIVGETRPLCNGQCMAAIASPEDSEVRKLLELTGITLSLPTFDTVEEAVEAATSPG